MFLLEVKITGHIGSLRVELDRAQVVLLPDCDARRFSHCPEEECDRESERLKNCPSVPVTLDGPG